MEALIERFHQNHVRYLLIGGQAMRLHGMPRFSMDWDFFIPAHDETNLRAIETCLGADADVPLLPLGPRGENFVQTYQTQHGLLQVHLVVPGLPAFDEVESHSVTLPSENGLGIRCLSGLDLLRCKQASNRPQDQLDIAFLQKKAELGLI